MRVSVGVQVGEEVGEFSEGVMKAEGVTNCPVGEEVGRKVGEGVGVEVEVARLFPSANESEKPPRSKPIETRAIMIPTNTCRKFFIVWSLEASLP